MTVSYSREVFTSTGTGIFLRLLGRWKGSIYKLVWRDLFVYVTIYTVLSVLYRFELSDDGECINKDNKNINSFRIKMKKDDILYIENISFSTGTF